MKGKTDSQCDTRRKQKDGETLFDGEVSTAGHESDANYKTVADGGLVVRKLDAIKGSDDIVRTYRSPGGGRLYAYRSDDENHHIVVSRGEELGTHWEQRVPAARERAVPGEKVWTIPDNWEMRVYSKRDSIAYALFYISDSNTWAKVSIPTNDQVTDAWYCVKKVGNLNVEPVGRIGTACDVYRFADDYEQYMEMNTLLRNVADNWDAVVDDLRSALDWVHNSLVTLEPDEQPIHADEGWKVLYHDERIFRPIDVLEEQINFSEYGITPLTLLDELRAVEILPSCYHFTLSIDASSIRMEYYLGSLIGAGASSIEATDYYMIEVNEMTIESWAENRGVDSSTVEKNIEQARNCLAESEAATK